MKSRYEIDDQIEFYFSTGFKKTRMLWDLFANAHLVITRVYLFKHFDEYCRQLQSNRQEDKLEVYWNASYNEKLIDYIKIIVAFETFYKAILLKKGYLIHKINPRYNPRLQKKQASGIPITIDEFYENNFTKLNFIERKAELNGLISYLPTINFSHTLNPHYQEVLQSDPLLVEHLRDINQKRNRLHLYSPFMGAFEVSRHINKWKFIKEMAFEVIEAEFSLINKELETAFAEIP